MCGIAGFYNFDGSPADPAVLRRMIDVQSHRGPDDQGARLLSLQRSLSVNLAADDDASGDKKWEGAIGFNRLSIVDLSANGHQPMCSEDGNVIIAFNGEVYNAYDFRDELRGAGYRFRSTTDTEIILNLYQEYGFDGMLSRLNGMFAICIVDLTRKCMLIARDHLGIKPFYWAVQGETLFFASEVKSFLEHPGFVAEVDESLLDEYLTFRYCAGEGSLFRGVQQLLPAHYLVVTPQGIRQQRYWELPDPEEAAITEADASEKLEELLARSVRYQLVSDVKVGCQLSGGIDSSLVTMLARSHFNADLETFSIVFQDATISEDPWISKVAAMAGAHSHRFMLDSDYVVGQLKKATWHLDQPLNLPNSVGIYMLAERSRSTVTVLLSGEGADELFGGYSRYFDTAIRASYGSALSLFSAVPRIGRRLSNRLLLNHSPVNAFILASAAYTPDQLRSLRPGMNLDALLAPRRRLFPGNRSDFVSACCKYDLQTYLADLLVRQDKMTMAHSMENRVPFLDRDLVTFIRGLPSRYLVQPKVWRRPCYSRNSKVLLKTVSEKRFGKEFTYRQKCGFPLPLDDFFRQGDFRDYLEGEVLPGIRQRGWLDSAVVDGWWRKLIKQDRRVGKLLWVPIALEIWAQQFLDRSPPRAPEERVGQIAAETGDLAGNE